MFNKPIQNKTYKGTKLIKANQYTDHRVHTNSPLSLNEQVQQLAEVLTTKLQLKFHIYFFQKIMVSFGN